jgi:hypothetical protein
MNLLHFTNMQHSMDLLQCYSCCSIELAIQPRFSAVQDLVHNFYQNLKLLRSLDSLHFSEMGYARTCFLSGKRNAKTNLLSETKNQNMIVMIIMIMACIIKEL